MSNLTNFNEVDVMGESPRSEESKGKRYFFTDDILQLFEDRHACDGQYFVQLKHGGAERVSKSDFDKLLSEFKRWGGATE